ncbi:MAG: DsbA family protein [Nocardia sp.]|nr:DsbA family protein [Nocardia sp.]
MSNRTTYGLAAAALVVAVVLVALFVHHRSTSVPTVQDDGYGPVHDPAVSVRLDPDGSIVLGKPSATKTIDVFEDPMCPACGSMEHYFGQQIAKLIDQGKFAVRYRLVNFLDPKSAGKDYSTRAVAASECVAAGGNGRVFSTFHQTLFTAKQPSEDGGTPTDQDLAAIAADAGAPQQIQQCIASGERVEAARTNAQGALVALKTAVGQIQTPTVLDGGKNVDTDKPGWATSLAG